MNPAKWIRWKYVGPLIVVIAALLVFFYFFFDPMLARAIEKFGGMANGAKVDVSGLKTKLFQGRLSIGRLQVADPDMPMQNRVEAGPLAFQLDLGELTGKRAIINEALLKGLAFGTPRKTSGALPKSVTKKDPSEPPSAAEKLVEKYKDRFKLNIDGIKGDVKSKIDFDPKDLQIVKSADGIKAKAQTLPDAWQKRAQDLNVDGRLKKAEDDLKTIRETPTKGTDAITAVPAALKKLKEVKDELDTLKKDVQKTKSDIQAESNGIKADVKGLSKAKEADVSDLMSRLNLDFASPDRLVEGMIGPLVLQRFKMIFHYVQLARKYMPSKKEKELMPPKPRVKGMDIEFPTPAALPRFWLQQAALEGIYESVAASGEMSNLTTDPARIGKPFKVDLKGKQGAQAYTAAATLDHTTDMSKDSLQFQASGLDVTKLMPAADGLEFSQGVAAIDAGFNLLGENNIGGQIEFSLSGLKFDDAALLKRVGVSDSSNLSGGDKLKADFMRNVARAIENMKQVAISAQVLGTWTDPNLKITSNLAPVLSNVVKDSVGNLVKDQKKELEAKLDKILADQQKGLNEKLSGLDSKVNGQLSEVEAKVQQKISEAAGINLSGGSGEGAPIPGLKIPSLNKLFKK